jgi:hypothetical protein
MTEGRLEFVQKPHLQMYLGHYVQAIVRKKDGPQWEWAIRLDNGVEIRNKDRSEWMQPDDLVGAKLVSLSMSEGDTTLHFSNGRRWSLNPTQYAISDSRYGGEAYPQWPGELEDAGISSHPEEPVSALPDDNEAWEDVRKNEMRQQDRRAQNQAREWIKEDGNEHA